MKKQYRKSLVFRNRIILLIIILLITIGAATTVIVLSQARNGIKKGADYKALSDLNLGYQYINLKYPGHWSEKGNRLYKGKVLINDNHSIVDEVGELTGNTVTIFHHNIRVSTNVKKFDGNRATGTTVSSKVAQDVLGRGKTYLGEADVVGHLYQTAYRPIRDNTGKIIGMWYVGVSEQFVEDNFSILVKNILLLFFIVLAVCSLLAVFIGSRFYVPIRQMEVYTDIIKEKNLELEKAYHRVDELARTDPLTGLLNRRAMNEKINDEKNRFLRTEKAFTLVMADIDKFKVFNDTYGHDCGDYVIAEISKMISAMIRKQDALSRWGGEEFLIMLTETNDKKSMEIAEKIRLEIASHEFYYNEEVFSVTMTFGVAQYDGNRGIETTIKKADEAMYQGKEKGRNIVIGY